MALTRGDKMIIIGAVALAATVVLGLAILKRPGLFSGGATTPVAAVPPAPTAAAPVPAVLAPVGAPAQSSAPGAPVAAAPSAATPTPSVPATVSPAPAVPASAAAPVADTVAPAASAPSSAKPAPRAAAPGDETLEKMFAEITGDTPAKGTSGKPSGKAAPHGSQAVPVTAPAEPAPAPAPPSVTTEPAATETPAPAETSAATDVASVPQPVPAKGKGKAKAAKQPEPVAAKPAATEPAAAPAPKSQAKAQAKPEPKALMAKTQAAAAKQTAASGTVIRVVAEEKPGEYQLVVYTSKPPASFTKMFLTNPPRLVLDVAGSWKYVGPGASDTGNAFIRHIRVGTHPDKFRVVLDMAPDATARLRGAPTAERVPEGVAMRIPK
ncbi:AMIN domain-containing protein [Solidesulfovibrio alcoholivorans]|uniref:AMIN domain-containing protein n=1 Tax=Solidesulfovibrio alcoholivorans TaxID=81406 RepID=UPI000494EEFC|nr:AMIN domain-containing protein [Solidesulfovibrio alcoholivorans]